MIKRVLAHIDRGMELFIAVIFLLMVLAGGLQVFNRFVLNQSLSWSEELQIYSHIWLIFLTIPVAYNRGSHIGMMILFDKLNPRAQLILSVITDILWLVLATTILLYTDAIMAVAKNQYSAGLGLRMDRIYFGMMISASYLALITVRKLSSRIAMIIPGDEE
ncbi:MAG: TRAP transporter small permease [Fidelibacterota bacterium]|nr:MAG: TRAP transporter small permease [Candidatus Neomarinimicrobiota bacterium]